MGKLFFYAVIIGASSIFFLLLPLVFTLDIYVDVKAKKFAFCLKFFDFIKVLGGYVTLYAQGFAVHISKKKAILVPFNDMENERKKFSFTECFVITEFSLSFLTGIEYFIPTAYLNRAFNVYFRMKNKQTSQKYKSILYVTDEERLTISSSVRFYFNLWLLIQEIFKTIKEKLYARKKQKNQPAY